MQIAVGSFHNCGLKPDGAVVCWGDDSKGQLAVPAGNYIAISAGALLIALAGIHLVRGASKRT